MHRQVGSWLCSGEWYTIRLKTMYLYLRHKSHTYPMAYNTWYQTLIKEKRMHYNMFRSTILHCYWPNDQTLTRYMIYITCGILNTGGFSSHRITGWLWDEMPCSGVNVFPVTVDYCWRTSRCSQLCIYTSRRREEEETVEWNTERRCIIYLKIFSLGEWYSCRGLELAANSGVLT